MNPLSKKILLVGNSMSSMVNFRGDLILHLSKSYTLCVAAPFDGSEAFLIKNKITCHDITVSRKGMNPLQDLYLFYQLLKLYQKNQPDIIFNYTIKPCIWGAWAANCLNIKNVAVITGLGYAFSKEGFLKNMVQKLYKIALKKTARICFLNEGDLNLFAENKLIAKEKAFLLSGEGVDCDFFKKQVASMTPDLKSSTTKFLLIGRILYDKGVEVYAKAAAQILKKNLLNPPEFYVLGPYDSGNPSHISPQTLANWPLKYLGNTKDVRPYIEGVNCIVLPSFSEGLPRVLLEAMAMEKPVIATRLSGTERLINEPENGFLCEARDVDSLVQAMEKCLNLKEEARLQMGEKNRRKVQQLFSNEVVFEEYSSILHQILILKI